MSYSRKQKCGLRVQVIHPKTELTLKLTLKWGEEDSNLRRLSQQIYSLPRLTASVSPRIFTMFNELSQQRDSNPRPADYKSAALPAELCWRSTSFLLCNYSKNLISNTFRTYFCIKKADLYSKRSAKIYTLVYITKKNAKKSQYLFALLIFIFFKLFP